jgi:hypothetical protein
MYEQRSSAKQTWRRMLAAMIVLAGVLIAFGQRSGSAPAAQPVPPDEAGVVRLDPEFAYGPVVGRAVIAGYNLGEFFTREVEYTLVDGIPMIEGDIAINLERPLTAGSGLPNTKFYWKNALVPYEIDHALPNQARVTEAIAHWEAKTSIRFVLRTPDNAKQYPNYVYFQPSNGCWSYVGMQGGRQALGLADGCSLGNTIHEIGHVVGLWHEQSRADRDDFVTIRYENIVPQMVFNFNKHTTDGVDIGAYDYDSIMHYPRKAFSKNGEDTIVPHGDQVIGQRSTLSPGDIAAVEYMYGRLQREAETAVAAEAGYSPLRPGGCGDR